MSKDKNPTVLSKRDFEAWKHILENPLGRHFLRLVLKVCQVDDDCFTGNNTTFYLEGRRSIALQIMREIKQIDPMLWLLLIEEEMKELAVDRFDQKGKESKVGTVDTAKGEDENAG